MVKSVRFSKSKEKRRPTKLDYFLGITSPLEGKLTLKNAHFYYKIPFWVNLPNSAGNFFSQHGWIVTKCSMGITETCEGVAGGFILS